MYATACRGHLARKAFGNFRETNAATKIQRVFRGWYVYIAIAKG